MIGQAELDARDAVGDLAGDELQAAARRLVVEEDAGDGKEVVALAVVDGDVVAEDLGDAVGATRIEGRHLVLRHFAHAAVHLARGGLVEADLRVDAADGFERSRDALRVELAGEHRLIPRCRHEGHGGKVVELVGVGLLDGLDEGQLVQEVGLKQRDPVAEVLDAPLVGCAQAPGDAEDLVALVEEEFGQVGAVLAGDAGDECALGHATDKCIARAAREGRNWYGRPTG